LLFYASRFSKAPLRLPEKIFILGSAPLDLSTKTKFRENLNRRIPPGVRAELDRLEDAHEKATDEAERSLIRAQNLELVTPFYNVAPDSTRRLSPFVWNYPEFQAIWDDLEPIIERGRIPKILERINVPVVSFHGASDPIPGESIHNYLRNHVRFFQTNTYVGAGHFAWVEPGEIGSRFVRDLIAQISTTSVSAITSPRR
jgi:pimeloyl-ACP methyl ester carboxylesterase